MKRQTRLTLILTSVFLSVLGDLDALASDSIVLEGEYLTINGPLTSSDQKLLLQRRKKVKTVWIKAGSFDLFTNIRGLPNLADIRLTGDGETNLKNLQAATLYYGNAKSITIVQDDLLDESAARLLGKFRGLRYLELGCRLSDVQLLKRFLGTSASRLEELTLNSPDAPTWKLPVLPRLQTLNVGGKVTSEFLVSLDAPCVEYLDMRGGCFHDALTDLKRFRRLRQVIIQNEKLSSREFLLLRKFGISKVIAHPE